MMILKNLVPLATLIIAVCLLGEAAEVIPIPRDPSFNPESAFEKEKKYFSEIELVRSASPHGILEHADVVYRTLPETPYGKRELRLNVYRPETSSPGGNPGVIMIHGGGWRSGTKSQMIPLAEQLALRGFVAVPVEYRLSPEARYPAAVHDVKASIRWLRAHAADYGIDGSRMAILGTSAGAQLAALVALTNDRPKFEGVGDAADFSSSVQALINIDGVVSFVHPEAEPEWKGTAASDWLGARLEESPELWKEASPLEHVSKEAPPVLFINSSLPRFHAGRDDLLAKLEEFGVSTRVHTFDKSPHPFWLFRPWFEPTLEQIVGFLEDELLR